jgi:hypothetical protein
MGELGLLNFISDSSSPFGLLGMTPKDRASH